MPPFRPTLIRLAISTTRAAARDALNARKLAPTFPVIPQCPSPTCECADMPPDLDIDRSKDLAGTMAAYSEQLIVLTGQADWMSKIEDEKKNGSAWGELVGNVKGMIGPKGRFHDPYRNVIVSASSFETHAAKSHKRSAQAILFPSFKMLDSVGTIEDEAADFVRAFLLPEKLHPAHNTLSAEEKNAMLRSKIPSHLAEQIHPISSPTILVCSHNSRDSRCGMLGPLLHAEFSQYINKRHTLRNIPPDELVEESQSIRTFTSHPQFRPDAIDRENDNMHPINVGMISHVGGHKWAGNVIVYIPPDYYCDPLKRIKRGSKPEDSSPTTKKPRYVHEPLDSFPEELSPLAGKGIWYGRVEPRHVEGIVEQTIGHGVVIEELFRGGINQDGSPLRL